MIAMALFYRLVQELAIETKIIKQTNLTISSPPPGEPARNTRAEKQKAEGNDASGGSLVACLPASCWVPVASHHVVVGPPSVAADWWR
jgi:hypothetical protein